MRRSSGRSGAQRACGRSWRAPSRNGGAPAVHHPWRAPPPVRETLATPASAPARSLPRNTPSRTSNMTIDKDAFSAGLGILANNFRHTVDAALSRVWYRTLSDRLTTTQFEQAVARSIAEDTFWPSAASLIAKVADTPEVAGLAALEHVGRVTSRHGGFRSLPHAVFTSEFDLPTRAAIAAVGGLHSIANTADERWAGLQKRFAAAYAKALSPQPQLAAAPVDGRVKSLVGSVARSLTSGRDRAAGVEVDP